jgi:two-component system, OmpR family, response regulator TrcR
MRVAFLSLPVPGHLNPKTALARKLLERERKAVNRESLLREIWDHTCNIGSNVVDVVVCSLRKKRAGRASMLGTVHGFGYRLRQAE